MIYLSNCSAKIKHNFYSKVQFDENSGCWNWIASKDKDGYGWFGYHYKNMKAHRFSYLLHNGNLDNSLTIDHLCKNKACVNPEHLELVTNKVNNQRADNQMGTINSRKTHCNRGHLLEGYNVIKKKGNKRICRTCLNYTERLRKGSMRDAGVLLQAEVMNI